MEKKVVSVNEKKGITYKRKWGKLKTNYLKEVITVLFKYK